MKRIFTYIFAIALSFNMFAQCPYTTAFDFTATDCHGTEVHLFDILDGGQYVLIDFFFTTCGPCQQATPFIVESYYNFGCNMHDVYYMEISTSDGDAACQNWVANYGVEYPTISMAGGGNTICTTYGISYYPTVILIAPDRSIVVQDLWPINSAQAVISALEAHGVQQHDCVPGPTGELTFNTDVVEFNIGGVQEPGMFTIYNQSQIDVWINDYQSEELPLVCLDNDGNDIKDMIIAPNGSLDVYVYYEEITKDNILNGTLRLMTTLGDYELPVVITDYEGVGELSDNNFSLYPNPANEVLVIGGENFGNVQIFNVMGQKIDEIESINDKDLSINVSNYENGVYFVKINGKTQRFVVTH